MRRGFARLLCLCVPAAPLAAALTVGSSALRVGPAVAGCAEAAGVHHAALVVEHGDGAVIRLCVSFSSPAISGEELLAASGVEYATHYFSGSGDAVCQIDHEPQQVPPNCFGSAYWGLFISRGDGPWTYSSQGMSSLSLADGDAEGFRFESGSAASAPPSPAGVCPPPATAMAAATATPAPRSSSPARVSATQHASGGASTAATAVTPSAAATTSANAAASGMSTPTAGAHAASAATSSPRPPSGPAAPLVAGAVALLLVATLTVRTWRARASRA